MTGAVIFGMVLVVAGAVAVFVSSNTVGAALLIAAGLALVVLGMIGRRNRAASVAAALTLGEVARRLTEADVAELSGDDDLARRLRGEALRLASAPGPPKSPRRQKPLKPMEPIDLPGPVLAGAELPSDLRRAAATNSAVVKRGHNLAKRPTLRREDVKKLFSDRDDSKRITALAILQKRPELGSVEILIASLTGSRSDVEQYQALLAARAAVDARALTAGEVVALKEEIRRQLATGRISATDSLRAAESILGF